MGFSVFGLFSGKSSVEKRRQEIENTYGGSPRWQNKTVNSSQVKRQEAMPSIPAEAFTVTPSEDTVILEIVDLK